MVRPNKKRNQILPLQNNARPYTSLPKREALATIGWNVLSQPSYSSALATSDLHLFEPVWDALRGRPLAEDVELNSVSEGLRHFSKEFYTTGVKDVRKIYVNFIIMLPIVSEKK
jgi:hypothetical protein